MINSFFKDHQANTVAIIVLLALIISWFTSIVIVLRDIPVAIDKGRYARLLPLFAFLGIPAALDLVQTKGLTIVFASIVLITFILNILIPILAITGKSSNKLVTDWYKWSIPISCLGGLAVAGYLTWIVSTGAQVMCGPVGHCFDVQNSRFAILFGVLPISVLGLAGYIFIFIAWLVWQYGRDSLKKIGILSIWGSCIFGVFFSAYLTFLEPFVIGATCMWCISSAILMVNLLLISTPGAQQVLTIEDD